MPKIIVLLSLLSLISIQSIGQTTGIEKCQEKTRLNIERAIKLAQDSNSVAAFNILEAELSSSISEKCKGQILFQLGFLGNSHNRLVEAVQYLEEANKIFARNEMYSDQIKANNIIGGCYFILGDYDITIMYTKKAIQIARTRELNELLDLLYNNLAGAYGELNKYDSALKYVESSIKISRENKDYSTLIHSLSTKAEILLKNNEFEKAEKYFHEVIKFGEDNNLLSAYVKSACLYGLGECKFKTGHNSEALELTTKGFGIAASNGHFVIAEQSARLLYEIWTKLNNPDSAYHYLDIYVAYLDQLQYKETLSQLSRFRIRETERLLIAKDQQAERQKYYTIIGSIIAFLSISILIIIYLSYRNSRKLNSELKRKNETIEKANLKLDELGKLKDKIFSAVIHDFKTPINTLEGMLNLLIKKYMTPEEAATNAKSLLQMLSKAKLSINSTIAWIKTQLDGYKTQIQPIELESFFNEIKNYHINDLQKKKIILKTSLNEKIEFESDKDLLFIILNNLITNAIKFSDQNSEIKITSVNDNKELKIIVEDHGIGMTQSELKRILSFSGHSSSGTSAESGSGLGLKVSSELIETLKGKITVNSEKGKGTTFTIILPLKLS